ncbi:unnamed protein product [Nezara viridula]|uniref:Uncharacterized protein n=1 Tax=Nezara viridula TaxID=85310 RepID=A0A9P0E9N7_NEZVI|nr:unnamed protein product [Nezara viridula]
MESDENLCNHYLWNRRIKIINGCPWMDTERLLIGPSSRSSRLRQKRGSTYR